MADAYKSYRIRTNVGQDSPNVVNVHLDQTYDELQILSLKINQKNAYSLYQSDKGVVVGRVLANGGFGVQNAKVSIFIESDDTLDIDGKILYPYTSVNDKNDDGVRYNLLPDFVDEVCHQNIGTFPTKRYVLDNQDVIEIFDKFWKYTTVTNASGDYMIYGIPVGNHTLHMDVDLSDIGLLSQRPRDLAYKGYNINLFESPTKFKKDTNLNSLAQIKSQDIGIYVYPFWGDSTENPDNIAVTRCDIQIDYKFEPTCVFMGSIITDTGSNAIGKNCAGTDNVGKMSDLVSGEGSIEMIRKTIDNKVEEFQIKGNRLIDGDGVWCYQIPMNLDYVMTDEFGNLVPTDNPDKGIPTRARVRFRISLDKTPNDNTARNRCQYLVPNNPRLDEKRFPIFTKDPSHEPDYEFGTNTREESYCDLFWNKVYSVKNYIPRVQKNTKITNRKHTGIKLINHYGDNNPMPYNNLSIKLSFTYRFICVLTKIFIKLVGFLNNILTILGAIPCKLYEFFHSIASVFNKMRIKIKAFGKTLINICLGCPIGALFDGIASIFKILTPSCIAISSEFCSGDVTHAYTFYPGCGQKGLANIIGPLADCVWKKTRENHYDENNSLVNQEDKTQPINNDAELYNCVESQLAEDNDATSFNFQNDWINGTLYSPLWFRKITPKRTFLFFFKRKAKDEWCSADQSYDGLVRIFHPCAVARTGTESNVKNHDGEDISGKVYYMTTPSCGKHDENCHEEKEIVPLNYGLIRTKETILGETAYYYKPVEFGKNDIDNSEYENGALKLLFATDIILLGSLNDCDLNGVPQFFKSLESSTYKLPPNMLFADNNIVEKFEEDGTISKEFDMVSNSEMTGNDWGNGNDDICGDTDGGLFYDIGCSTIKMIPKSCINVSRICEFGVSLDESKLVPDLTTLKTEGDNAYSTLIPDGFISKDELYNDNERSMFATLNGNELMTKLNTENGLKEYDFRHLYVDNFDKSLHAVMKASQTSAYDCTYKYNYNLEAFSEAYYDFRMGKNPFFYDGDHSFPRYENSFYFYFGLKVGKTALDKFNSQFFAECHDSEEAVSPIGIDALGNSWCLDFESKNGQRDGYVKIDLSNVSLPCDILIQDKNSSFEFSVNNVDNEKVVITDITPLPNEMTEEDYVRICDGNKCSLPNGSYIITVTDNDGEIITASFDMSYPTLRYSLIKTNFKYPEKYLIDTYGTLPGIAKAQRLQCANYTRPIGGTIAINGIVDGFTGDPMTIYEVEVSLVNEIENYSGKGIVHFRYDNGQIIPMDEIDSDVSWENILSWEGNGHTATVPFIIGIPKGDEMYRITITQLCKEGNVYLTTGNKTVKTVMVGNLTPYKLYINDIIDYDVIKDWGTGYELLNNTISNGKVNVSDFDRSKFSDKWLNISKKDSGNYDWQELLTYKKALDKINNAIKYGALKNNNFPLSTKQKIRELDCIDAAQFDTVVSETVFKTTEGNITVPVLNGNLKDDWLTCIASSVSYDRTQYSGDDVSERDAIIENCERIMTIKDEFVSRMKETFWMTCQNGYKDIYFKAVTDDMPVAFYIAHRSEKASSDGSTNVLEYNEKNKLTYSFNEKNGIDDIMIPSLSYSSSERFGIDKLGLSNPSQYVVTGDVTLSLDNLSKFTIENRQKYAFFVGVINSVTQNDGVPTGETIPKDVYANNTVYPNKLFGFHILDKMMEPKYIAWSSMYNIPYFKPSDGTKNGQYVNINGLFAGKIYNGVPEFKKKRLGSMEITIVTMEGEDEDSMPTKRYVSGTPNMPYADYDYMYSFKHYEVQTHDESSIITEYIPLEDTSYTFTLEDSAYCTISNEVYGATRFVLTEDALNNCKTGTDIESMLSFDLEEGPNDVVYFVYKLENSLDYPLNWVTQDNNNYDVISQHLNTTDTEFNYNDPNHESYKIFGYNVNKIALLKNAHEGLTSKIYDSAGREINLCDYFGLDENCGYGNKSVGTTGEFTNGDSELRGDFFVVAVSEDGACRAISPVYSFTELCGRGELWELISKEEDGTEEIEVQVQNPNNPNNTTETKVIVKYKEVTEYKAVFSVYIDQDGNPYYFANFPYSIDVTWNIDEYHKISGSGDVTPYSNNESLSSLLIGIDEQTYQQAVRMSSSFLWSLTRQSQVDMYLTDVTGLRHFTSICGRIIQKTKYSINFDLNGHGFWRSEITGSNVEDKMRKTIYREMNETYQLPCDGFTEGSNPSVDCAFTVLRSSDDVGDITFLGWSEDKDAKRGDQGIFTPGSNKEITNQLNTTIWYAVWGEQNAHTVQWVDDTHVVQWVDDVHSVQWVDDTHSVQWVDDTHVVQWVDDTHSVQWVDDTNVVQWVDDTHVVQWVDDYESPVSTKVNVTFKLNTSKEEVGMRGEWYPSMTTEDYIMEVDKNSTVTCDRNVMSQDAEHYGFNGWNTNSSASSGSNTVSVGTEDITVYATFSTKDCGIYIKDFSYPTEEYQNNIFLELNKDAGASPADLECVNTYASVRRFINNNDCSGTIYVYGVGNDFILRMYYRNNPPTIDGQQYSDIYKNSQWLIDGVNGVNSTLVDFNICYEREDSSDSQYITENGHRLAYTWNGTYDEFALVISPIEYSYGVYVGGSEQMNEGEIYILESVIISTEIEFYSVFIDGNANNVEVVIGEASFRFESDDDYEPKHGIAGYITAKNGEQLPIRVKLTRRNNV